MTQLKDGGRQPSNREERPLSASTVIARGQGNGWDEPCKSRGLRTVLWAAGGEIPPADPAVLCLYLMGLNLSNRQIAQELDLSESDAQDMTEQLRNGIVAKAPPATLEGRIDEVYVVAGHKGQPAEVEKR